VDSHEEEDLACRRAIMVNGADVRMTRRAGGTCLSNESRFGRAIPDQVARQHLDGHSASELEVRRSIENSHPASAKPVVQSVMRQDAAHERVNLEECWSRE